MASSVAVLLTKFRARFTEFASLTDDNVTMYIEDALAIFGRCDRAVIYLAAHLIALDQDQENTTGIDGGVGEITSETVGQKSLSYKTQSERGSDVYYTSTKYGRRFLEYRRVCVSRAFSVRVY